ncbi:MAG: acyltransferase domain-containing protein, partial [bacterium]
MGQDLHTTYEVIRKNFDTCVAYFNDLLDTPLQEVMWNKDHKDLLNSTLYTQPALFAYEFALYKLFESIGVQASAVMGHSVGEYVAAVAAGIMSSQEAMKIVIKRATLMNALPLNGGMMAVSLEASKVKEMLTSKGFDLDIAAINTSTQTVVSGLKETLLRFKDFLDQNEIKAQELSVSHAFHSKLLDPILDDFEQSLKDISFKTPEISLISNLTGEVLKEAPTASYYKDHLRNAILFDHSIKTSQTLGISTYLEVGPSPILSTFVRSSVEKATVIAASSPKKEALQTLVDAQKSLYEAGILLDFEELFKDLNPQKIDLPLYPFDKTKYWPKALETVEKSHFYETKFVEKPLLEEEKNYKKSWLIAGINDKFTTKVCDFLSKKDLKVHKLSIKNSDFSSTEKMTQILDNLRQEKGFDGVIWLCSSTQKDLS